MTTPSMRPRYTPVTPQRPTHWPWVVMALFWLLALWAGMQQLDAQAAADAQHIAQKQAAQKARDAAIKHPTKLDQAAHAVCRESHGLNATHWWDGGVLVCARDAHTQRTNYASNHDGANQP